MRVSPREDVAPAELGRHPAADQRPGGHRGARDPADDPERQRARFSAVGGRNQRHDRREHKRRAKPLDKRPADQQDRQVGAERGGQRSKPIDPEAKSERPVAPDDVAELRPREHEGRHDQRVRRDRQLHALDRRVEVRDDLRDRHVHDAAVEHHHELGRREYGDRQAQPRPGLLASRGRFAQSTHRSRSPRGGRATCRS
jgi:hypothetical protein